MFVWAGNFHRTFPRPLRSFFAPRPHSAHSFLPPVRSRMSSLPSTVPTPPPTLVVGSKGSGSGTASSGDDRTGDKSMQPPPVPAKTAAATGTASTSLIDRLRLRWRRASLEMDGAASHSRSVYVNAAPPLADYDEYGRLAVHYETNEIHTNKYSVFTFIRRPRCTVHGRLYQVSY